MYNSSKLWLLFGDEGMKIRNKNMSDEGKINKRKNTSSNQKTRHQIFGSKTHESMCLP